MIFFSLTFIKKRGYNRVRGKKYMDEIMQEVLALANNQNKRISGVGGVAQ